MTLNATLNDLSLALPLDSTLTDVIGVATPQLQTVPLFAASVSDDLVPRTYHAQYVLRTGDYITSVQPVVGDQESSMTTTSPSTMTGPLRLYDETFSSRLLFDMTRCLLPRSLEDVVRISNPATLTAALHCQGVDSPEGGAGFWKMLRELDVPVLPNITSCYSVDEAYTLAQMSREVFETSWIRLEVIGDDYTLQPDTLALSAAAERLIRDGFKVLLYYTEDLVLCHRLLDVDCRILMPWAAPIDTDCRSTNLYDLRLLHERLPNVPLIVDTGLDVPSHATQVMEWGYDAVLFNTAAAQANDPVVMVQVFALAAQVGRLARLSGPILECDATQADTPVVGLPLWYARERSI